MKIGYLSVLPPPGDPAVSGVFKVSQSLLRQYEDFAGIEVEAVTLIDGLERPQIVQRGAVRYHYLGCRLRGKTATLYVAEIHRLKAYLRVLEPDVVHGQPTPEYLMAATGISRPAVITIHGLIQRETKGVSFLSGRFWANFVRERLQQRACRRARHIISISPYVDDYLRGVTQARIWPVPNPIDPEFFTVAPVDRSGLRILCVGNLAERKNQAFLVRACAELARTVPDFQCQLVGKPLGGYDAVLRGLVGELGLRRSVAVRGMISQAELLEAYAWANVVVLPSREETSPLSMIQAMACGRIVMGARAAGIPMLVENGRLGTLFDLEDPGALANSLATVLREPAGAWQRAEVAAVEARRFMPGAVARRTVDIYGEILQMRA